MPNVYTPKQVIKKLEKLGFRRDRQSADTRVRAVIPFHLKEIPKGTMSAILRESKISMEEFEQI